MSKILPRPSEAYVSTWGDVIDVRLTAIRYAADGINLYEFSALDGLRLPSATAGSHIDVELPNGLIRQYSLIAGETRPAAYVIGVKKDPDSRGGSRFMHDALRVGETLKISPPRNNFQLDEDANHTVLIAGGIGITPIFAMVGRLQALGRSYELHYACRSRADAVFEKALSENTRVTLNFDQETGRFLDLKRIVAEAPTDSHFYCCGPTPMLAAFEAATAELPAGRAHVEYFSAKHEVATEGGFVVELARSGGRFDVPAGRTILDVLRDVNIDVPFACEQGLCGSCETRVLSGVPDHRDSILTDAEREASETMMICCSGARSSLLVLDL